MFEEGVMVIIGVVCHVLGWFVGHGYHVIVRSRCVIEEDKDDVR